MPSRKRRIALAAVAVLSLAASCAGCVERDLAGTRCDPENPCGELLFCHQGRCVEEFPGGDAATPAGLDASVGPTADASVGLDATLSEVAVVGSLLVAGTSQETCPTVSADLQGELALGCIITSGVALPSQGTISPLSAPRESALVVRLDPARGLRWAQVLGNAAGAARVHDVALTADGGVAVLGVFENRFQVPGQPDLLASSGGMDTYLVQLDPAGEWKWHRGLGRDPPDAGGPDASCREPLACRVWGEALVSAPDDWLFATGKSFCCAMRVDEYTTVETPGVGEGVGDLFVLGIEQGIVQWLQGTGGEGDDDGRSISFSHQSGDAGTVLLAGHSSGGPLTFARGTTASTSGVGANALVLALGGAGELESFYVSQSASFESAESVVADPAGGYLVAGSFRGQLPVFGNEGKELVSAGGSDVFVARYGADRALRWVHAFGGAADEDTARVALTAEGAVWLAFSAQRPLEGAQELNLHGATRGLPLSRHGDRDIAVARFDPDGTLRRFGLLGGSGRSAIPAYGPNGVGKIVPLPGGRAALAGWFTGPAQFGTKSVTSQGYAPDAGTGPADGVLLILE